MNTIKKIWITVWVLIIGIIGNIGIIYAQHTPNLLRQQENEKSCQEWVEQTMQRLTLKEKIGQMFVYTIAPQNTKQNQNLLHKVINEYKIGGLLFSGGDLYDQARLINEAQRLTKIPLFITFDGEWGLSMRLKNTPRFPRNMTLGCIQDNNLITEYGKEVARQCRELGVHINFAPVADVNINPENPVINTRSFGENPHEVAEKVVAYAKGLESGGVISVAKHFPGHGDTNVDSHKALPTLNFTRCRLDSIELYPFRKIIESGLSGIMVGHLQVPAIDSTGQPASLSKSIVNDLLQKELGFEGLVFTDALAMKGVGGQNRLCVQAIKAGNDILLVPRAIKEEMDAVLKAVANGEISKDVIEEKCKKILTYKYILGVSNTKPINLVGLEQRINTPQAITLIQQLQTASLTVVGNKHNTLPLHFSDDTLRIISIGKANLDTAFTNRLRTLSTIKSYQINELTTNAEKEKLLNIVSKDRQVIVSIGTSKLKAYTPFLNALTLQAPTIYALFIPFSKIEAASLAFKSAEAIIIAHSTDPFVQQQTAEAIYGRITVNGRLSAKLSSSYKVGDGVSIESGQTSAYSPEELGIKSSILNKIDSIALSGIKAGAYPGCQIYILRWGKELYNKCFGTFTYEKGSHPVKQNDLYDLASLTKTTATLLAVMKLYDQGAFNLNDPIADYLPFLRNTNKQKITIRDLLFHESGMPASIFYYRDAIDPDSYQGTLFKNKRDANHTIKVSQNLYAQKKFRFKKEWISSQKTDIHYTQIADNLWLSQHVKKELRRALAEAKLKPKAYRYSCPNFILLQEMVEQLTGKTIDEYLKKEFYAPMNLSHLLYYPLKRFKKEEIAPTVKDDYLRKGSTLLQGYVHDETAAFNGGISGNAGLFGSADDVAAIYEMLLNGGMYQGKRYLSEATCKLFTTATSRISRRGLGFDRPDTINTSKSPCAESAPASVYGHTGFTGTCAWVDPEYRIVYVFLCNRIHPHPWNNKLGQLNIRTEIQETLYKALMSK